VQALTTPPGATPGRDTDPAGEARPGPVFPEGPPPGSVVPQQAQARPVPGAGAVPATRRRASWGIGAAVLALLVAAACGLGASFLLSVLLPPDAVGEAGAPGAVLVVAAALAQALGALLVGAWATSPRRGRGGAGLVAEVGLRFRWGDLPLGVFVALVALPTLGLLLSLLAAAGLVETGDVDNTTVLFAGAGEGFGFLLVAATVALVAPLWEEVLFRGLLLRSLQRRLGAVPAVLLSSAAFGVLHAQPGRGVALVVVTGALGVVLAVVTLRAGRLGPAVVAHAAFNGVTVLLVGVQAAGPAV
jgi:membrane protease YdiL (CAAX protease family)